MNTCCSPSRLLAVILLVAGILVLLAHVYNMLWFGSDTLFFFVTGHVLLVASIILLTYHYTLSCQKLCK